MLTLKAERSFVVKKLLLLTVIGALMIAVSPCWADIPQMINYQGMLTQTDDTPLDGTYDLTFKIYGSESGDDSLWWEYHTNVQVTDGLFNIILGSISTLDLAFDTDYWLGISVGTETELSPRIRLTSVGYAYRAKVADSASVAVSAPTGGGWTDEGSVVRLETSTDKVGIGTASPEASLHIEPNGITDGLTVKRDGEAHINIETYGNSAWPIIRGIRGRGSAASPSEVESDDQLLVLSAMGQSGPGTQHGGGQLVFKANQNWSGSSRGSRFELKGIVDDETSLSEWMTVVNGKVGINSPDPRSTLELINPVFGTMNVISVDAQGGNGGLYFFHDHAHNASWAFEATYPPSVAAGQLVLHSSSGYDFSIQTTGNVGIGTFGHAPSANLHVEDFSGDNSVRISCPDGYTNSLELFEGSDYGFEFEYSGTDDKLHLWSRKFSGNEDIRMTWLKNGDVGIGTTDPVRDLHIASTGFAEIQLEKTDATTNNWHISVDADGLYFTETDVAQRLTLEDGGNVGIGTTNPAYKLDVNGDINIAGSYNIKKAGDNYTHPDYVFEPDYQLMSLDKLKKYVFENKSLPNVISAEDVKKNDGFKMDELLIQMLEKIEEQTLYIFQLEERIAELERGK
jgi:hypothetical protein